MNKFKLLSAGIILSASSFVLAGPGAAKAIINSVGNAGEQIIDSVNAATGGIVSKGGKVDIENRTRVGDVGIAAGKGAEVDAQVGHVGGIKAKGDIKVKSKTRVGDMAIVADEGAEVGLKIGGVGK
jgi:hypothetical protein